MTPAIAKALVAAQRDVKSVAKGSTNKFHGYNYASADDVAHAGRAALNAHGLVLMCTGWTLERSADPEEWDRLHVRYLLVHDGGDAMELASSTPIIPEKGRPEDKAEAAALTYSLGYTMRGLLCIHRGASEDDPDTRDDSGYESRKRPEQRREQPRQSQQLQRAATQTPANLLACKTLEQLIEYVKKNAGALRKSSAGRAKVGDHLRALMGDAPDLERSAAFDMLDAAIGKNAPAQDADVGEPDHDEPEPPEGAQY